MKLDLDQLDDPALQAQIERQIVARLRPHLGRKMTQKAIERFQEMVNDVVTRFRLSGLPVPDLIVIGMVHHGWVQIYRRELDQTGVENIIKFLGAKFGPEAGPEIAGVVARAWPWYRGARDKTTVRTLVTAKRGGTV